MLALELTPHRAQATRIEQRVRLTADPLVLLTALGQGRLPEPTSGDYDAVIPPP